MDNWRDQGVNYNQEVTRMKSSSYRKPPIGRSSNWQQSVPSWEKKFCASVGSIPWKKLVETKKIIHLYDNIIKWNDSAGKEAFENAKYNFYANMYNLRHDKWSPDPDIYIDKINWDDTEVDPSLILDLESDPVCPDPKDEEQVIIFGSSFPPSYQSFSPYGWGDSDDDNNDKKKKDKGAVVDNNDNWWGWNGNNEMMKKDGDSRNDYWGWNVYDDDNNYFYGDVKNKGGGDKYKTSSRRNNGNVRKSRDFCGSVNTSSRGAVVGHRWSVKKQVS